jgi:hypothetical protein
MSRRIRPETTQAEHSVTDIASYVRIKIEGSALRNSMVGLGDREVMARRCPVA